MTTDTKRRVNLMLDNDVVDMLDELADGERKRGLYIGELIRRDFATKRATPDIRTMDLDALRLMLQGLAGRVQACEGEMMRQQSQLAAMIAKNAV